MLPPTANAVMCHVMVLTPFGGVLTLCSVCDFLCGKADLTTHSPWKLTYCYCISSSISRVRSSLSWNQQTRADCMATATRE